MRTRTSCVCTLILLSLFNRGVWAEEPSDEAAPIIPEAAPADLPIPELPPPPPPPPPASGGAQTFPAMMNPSISLNGLFLGSATWEDGALAPPQLGPAEEGAEEEGLAGAGETYGTGLNVQEMELQIFSQVDPYFKANVVLAIPGLEGIEIEEGFVTLTSIPRLLVNIGKIKEPFGRENTTHTHGLLTIDRALISQRIFGEEGLNDVGLNAALLLPLPFYSELTLGVDRGANEVVLGSGLPEGLGAMAHWKNLLELSYATSLELGLSGLTGRDAFDGQSLVGGVDLTLRSHGRGRHQWNRLVWQSELIAMQRGGATVEPSLAGLYSSATYAVKRRIWLGGRFDLVGFDPSAQTLGGTVIGVLAPTEFSAVRLQAQRQWLPEGHTLDSLTAQLNFTVGAHPAHAY